MPTDQNLDGGRLWNTYAIGLSVANNASYYIGVQTGSKPLKWSSTQFQSQGDDLISSVYENQTWTGGVLANIQNRNRFKTSPTPDFGIINGVVPDNDVTVLVPLSQSAFRSSSNAFVSQNLTAEDAKWILKPDSFYIIRLENGDVSAATFDYGVVFEEMEWGVI